MLDMPLQILPNSGLIIRPGNIILMQVPNILRWPDQHSMRLPTLNPMLMLESRIHLIESFFQEDSDEETFGQISVQTDEVGYGE